MKKIIIIPFVLLFFCQNIANAQYESIFGQNTTQFNIFHEPVSGYCITNHILQTGDFEINGIYYKKFGNIYLREDTVSGKVYMQIFNYSPPFDPSRDVLIMDLNLQVGDTFSLHSDYYFISQSISMECPNIIVDSVFYENGRKVVRTNCNPLHCIVSIFDPYTPLSFIEGVGPNRGPFYWLAQYYHDAGKASLLLCFYKDDTLSYMNPLYNTCDTFPDLVSIHDQYLNGIDIFPNPIEDNLLNISFDGTFSGLIFLYNALGSKIYSIDLSNVHTHQIKMMYFSKGIYFLKIIDKNSNLLFLKKIIKN